MAKNTGRGRRIGAVKGRSEFKNGKTWASSNPGPPDGWWLRLKDRLVSRRGCNNCVALVLAGARFDEVIVTVLTVSRESPRDHQDGDPQVLTLLPV